MSKEHFLHQYSDTKSLVGDLILLSHGNPSSFAVADGKVHGALLDLDKIAQSQMQKNLLIETRAEVEAYENCGKMSLDNCYDDADRAQVRQTRRVDELIDQIKPCDKFDLPNK